jgi:hypothetical protein
MCLRKSDDGFVYFLRPVGAQGPVKIGCSSVPLDRLRNQMNWSPLPLELAASLPGGLQLEWAFHAKFLHLHTHSEWFREDPELTATIEAIKAGSFDPESLPAPKRLKTLAQIQSRTAPALAKAKERWRLYREQAA